MAVTLTTKDIRDRHILTKLITKQLHEDSSIGAKIAPLEQTNSRHVKVAIRTWTPAGLGQFKAINANTPIRRGGGDVEQQYTQLVDLEEMEVLDADDLINLASPDDRVAKAAARDVVEIGKELAIRNRNLTRWMRWQAFKDELSITFNDGTATAIDYDLDNSDGGMSESHIVSASTDWDTAGSASPITDVRNWEDILSTDAEVDGAFLHVNKKTFRTMQQIDEIEGYLLDHYGPLKIPNAAAMKEIFDLTGGIIVENGYYVDTSGTRHYYIPEGYALMTTPYTVDGESIAQVYDGPAVMVRGDDLVVANNPGLQVEVFVDKKSKNQFIRLSTARMVWLRRECFLYCHLYTA